MFSEDTPGLRPEVIRERHDAISHVRGPGCHCRAVRRRPDGGSGCHPFGTCFLCDVYRDTPKGRAERLYWLL